MNQSNRLTLGLDLGITSVGYGIVDDNLNIVNKGVRLFDENTADSNVSRRNYRHIRRNNSRKVNRLNALKYLLVENKIITDFNYQRLSNVYDLRIKGLTHKLTNVEFANAIVNLIKHRGVDFEVVDDGKDDDDSLKGSIAFNTNELRKKNYFVCQLQKERLSDGKIRNTNNVFKTEDYIKELKQILSNQGYSDDFNNKVIDLMIRKRHFSEGPGSEKFPTDYGSWRIINGQLEHVNLIEIMKGKCSIYKDQPRIAKFSLSALLFNLLNDLNNLKLVKRENVKITKTEKNIILKTIFTKGNITVNGLLKILNLNLDDIKGFRIDAKENPILTDFSKFNTIRKLYLFDSKSYQSYIDDIDNIVEILTKTKVLNERVNELRTLNLNICDDNIQGIANLPGFSQYHSLSKKAISEFIPELYETDLNQMGLMTNRNISSDISKSKNIQFNDEFILSPVTKRVHREAIKVINELRDTYGEFDSIVIETTRAKNSKEEEKFYTDSMKENVKQKEAVEKFLLELEKNPEKYSATTKLKIRLAKQQDFKTAYAGLQININALLNDPKAYEIEHIIPFAISNDNSLDNKVLASVKENQDKGKNTPYHYIKSGKLEECNGTITNWEQFKDSVITNKLYSKKKKQNLLDERDLYSVETSIDFVNRNLSDTSYAIRSLMTTLKDYYITNDINTKIFTVKGKITNAFRQICHLPKNRDEFKHHAIDALIIAASAKKGVFNKTLYSYEIVDGNIINKETGEVRTIESPLENEELDRFVSNLRSLDFNWNDFSYKVDTKSNRTLCDDTIYSTRQVEENGNTIDYKIGSYKNIYNKDGESLAKLIRKGNGKNLLMYKNDYETYKILEEICKQYKENNPFLAYKNEFGYIRKYSKKGNGPIITKVKYNVGKVTSYLDISHKYNIKNKKVIKTSLTPYRLDVYYDGFTYKILVIKHLDFPLNEVKYKELLKKSNISSNYSFRFSLYKNNIIYFDNGKISGYFKYLGYTESGNKMEIKFLEKTVPQNSRDKYRPVVSSKVTSFKKVNISVTGKYNIIEQEKLTFK